MIDRIWPRGVKREQAKIDLWLKEAAPSTALRKWFNHDPAKWTDFASRYRNELVGNPALDELLAAARQRRRVTLVFAARDEAHNNAIVLQALCDARLKE